MSTILTKSELSQIARSGSRPFSKELALAKVEITRNMQKRSSKSSSIFLSHSHKDKEAFENFAAILEQLDVNVYIDWLDEDMPYPPTGRTATRLKQAIKLNKKFILVATNNAIESKWCNWELGLGDAAKYIDNIAIMPIADNTNVWSGNEYLQIYPYIEKNSKMWEYDNYSVVFPDGTKIDLKAWLKN